MRNGTVLEVCAGSLLSAIAAWKGGASRIELCSALSDGGVTPSVGTVRAACQLEGLSVHVLVRPRCGDFLYTEAEIESMIDDIACIREQGAHGVVLGALTSEGRVDEAVCGRLIDAAAGMEVTFHRAFDLCRDPFEALDVIAQLGCSRILTSGQASKAEIGIPLLRQLVERAAGRLIVMPGGGVNAINAKYLLVSTGATELHASMRNLVSSAMKYRRKDVFMGATGMDEYSWMETSAEMVRELIRVIESE